MLQAPKPGYLSVNLLSSVVTETCHPPRSRSRSIPSRAPGSGAPFTWHAVPMQTVMTWSPTGLKRSRNRTWRGCRVGGGRPVYQASQRLLGMWPSWFWISPGSRFPAGRHAAQYCIERSFVHGGFPFICRAPFSSGRSRLRAGAALTGSGSTANKAFTRSVSWAARPVTFEAPDLRRDRGRRRREGKK